MTKLFVTTCPQLHPSIALKVYLDLLCRNNTCTIITHSPKSIYSFDLAPTFNAFSSAAWCNFQCKNWTFLSGKRNLYQWPISYYKLFEKKKYRALLAILVFCNLSSKFLRVFYWFVLYGSCKTLANYLKSETIYRLKKIFYCDHNNLVIEVILINPYLGRKRGGFIGFWY